MEEINQTQLHQIYRNRKSVMRIIGVAVATLSIYCFCGVGDIIQKSIPRDGMSRLLRSLPDMLKEMHLKTIQDITEVPRDAATAKDIPFFWVIPKSGTSSVKSVLTKCLDLRVASSHGAIDYEKDNDELRVIDLKEIDTDIPRNGKFLNVNFGYLSGIQKAKELKMAESGLADAAVTSYFHQSSEVFSEENPARMFAIFRHPIHRLISDYYYQKIAVWEMTHDETTQTNITLLEYAHQHSDNNWMVRMLANVQTEFVTPDDLHFAKSVLKKKCLILMMDQFEESLDRLITYMGWSDDNPSHLDETSGKNKCYDAFANRTPANTNEHPDIEPSSKEWEALRERNEYDINLYHHAISLFQEQKEMIATIKLNRAKEKFGLY